MRLQFLAPLLAAVMLVASACKRDGAPPAEGAAPVETTGSTAEATARTAPTRIEELYPSFASVDPPHLIPTGLTVSFSTPVFTGPFPRANKGDLMVAVEPAVDFQITIDNSTSARMVPAKPLTPGQRYELKLKEAGSGSSHLKAREGSEVSHVFTTPPFQFVRGQLAEYGGKKKASVDVVFSAPLASKVPSVKATAGGAAASAKCKIDNSIIKCTVDSALLDKAKTIELSIAAVESKGGQLVADVSARIELPRGKDVQILGAALREQAAGYVIDVVCTDDASGEPTRDEYDDATSESYQLSPRCVLDDDYLAMLQVTDNKGVSVSATKTGFRVFANMKRGSVTMRIDAGARTIDGATLKETFERTFTVPARKPKVELVASGRYLPREAWRSLPVRHTNITEGVVEVRHVPPDNLVFWLTDKELADERTSNLIYTANIALKGEPDTSTTTWLDVSSWLPATTRGVLSISIRSADKHARDGKRLLLTDLNLVAKRDADGKVHVWALGIGDAKLQSGVVIKAVTPSGRVVSTCTTGADGCVLAAPASTDLDKTPPMALIAQRGDDLTYLKYDELEAPIAESAVQGIRAESEPPYRVALFFERGVYRPGETAHLTLIARDKSGATASAGLPLSLELFDPRGRKSKTVVVKPNSAGMATTDFAFTSFADTGVWQVMAKTGDTELATLQVFVEEFVPERMKVTVTPPAADAMAGDSTDAKIEAVYLFGGSAKGSPVELTCKFEPMVFAPKDGPAGFQYGTWHPSEEVAKGFVAGSARGEVGESGSLSLSCPELGKGARLPPGRVLFDATVFEAGSGRVTHGDGVMRLHPAKSYLGLRASASRASVGKPFSVEGIVVDWNGKPLAAADASVALSLYRVDTEYRWAYDGARGTWRTFYDERLVLENKQEGKLAGGKLSATFTPSGYARGYVVRARAGDRESDVFLEGRYWWSGSYGDGDRTPRPDAPATVPMTVPEVVSVGEQASAEVTIPFEGQALFTLEGDSVFKSEWRAVKAGKTSFAFTVDRVVPNAYLSVFVVKDPHLESKQAFLPERAFSVQGVRVTSKESALAIAITVKDEILPRSTLEIEVQVDPREQASVVVAAVDEGILSLTKYQTPNPVALLHPKRALGVTTYETVGWDVLLPNASSGSTGGDAEGGAGGRVSPVKPVALFSGLVQTDASGRAKVKLDVPSYRGKLRVMAFAATATRVGSADKGVVVKEPLVLQTTLPRFLVRGDRAEVPVSVSNTSGQAREATVRVTIVPIETPGLQESDEAKASPKVTIAGPSSHALNLSIGETEQVAFALEAKAPIGAVRVRVEATSGDVTVFEELDVPLSVDAPRSRRVKRLEIKSGSNDLKPLLGGWLPTTERSTIVVSSSPWMDAFSHLSHLINYPYGCIEQTSSSTLPLLFLGQLAPDLVPDRFSGTSVDAMAQAGVDRILSMQTPVGGFSYWPGGSVPEFWATGYATHVLMLAQKAKLNVPQGRIDDALAYLENEVANVYEARDVSYGVYRGEAYAHYVLAAAGKGRKARIEKVLATIDDKNSRWNWSGHSEARFLLQAALYAAGDRRGEKALRDIETDAIGGQRLNDWTYFSEGRARGMALTILAEQLGPNDSTTRAVAETVANYLRDKPSDWYSTQELAWGITGLGMLTKSGGSVRSAKLIVDGKERTSLADTPATAALRKKEQEPSQLAWFIARASERKSIEVSMSGGGPLWAVVSSEGIELGGVQTTGGDGLSIAREYLGANGKPATNVALGDVITVVVSIKNLLGRQVKNVAVVDRLPAGFEIENARLAAARRGDGSASNAGSSGDESGDEGGEYDGEYDGEESGGNDNALAVEHMNIRDDRIEVFGTLRAKGTGKVEYTVRATTAGTFSAPPAEAQAMYDPTIWARVGSEPVLVRGPWGKFFE